MKIRRKTNECLNCGSLLNNVYNFCPICGQENTTNNVSFNMLVADFFNTFFALDSKFAKSIKPFLIRPGFLTNQYLNGKRATFAHPLRFYLIVSLFFFFVFTIVTKESIEANTDNAIVKTSIDIDKIKGLDKKEIEQIKLVLGEDQLLKIERDMKGAKLVNLQKALERNITPSEKKELITVLDSTTLRALALIPKLSLLDSLKSAQDSIEVETENSQDTTLTSAKSEDESLDINMGDEDDNGFFDILGKIDYEKIEELKNDLTITDNQIYDSLELENISDFQEHIVRQIIRVNRTDNTLFVEFITKNLPLMMLLLIPIFALVLKLLYVRRKHLYIVHLIHALHLHTFAYFLYGISLIALLNIEDEDLSSYVGIASFLIVSTYAFVSFLRVYKQHWFKTLIKFNMTGAIYMTCIFVFFLAELLISFLLF
ncbi:MAG: DUF3667 domain-containing protein [Bacteroidota bacterium]